MIFWAIAGGLALLCAFVLGLFGLKGQAGDEPPAAYDLKVYRDQLKEVDRDLARGVIAEEDAERIRAEVSRRILAADAQLQATEATGGKQPLGLRIAILAAAVAVVGGAGALYARMGVPGYEDLPLQLRLATSNEARANRPSQAELEEVLPEFEITEDIPEDYQALITRLRDTVENRPDDMRGLQLLARTEASIGNLPAAHAAQTKLIELKGDAATAEDFAELADMMISSGGGFVSAEAEIALREALDRNPQEPRARYYMGLYLMQVDRPDMAFRTWDALLRESTSDAPWVPLIRGQIEELAWRAGIARYQLLDENRRSGPTLADMTAARDMTPEEREGMIRSMVAGLDERIREEGGTPGEWARLINAYAVLGDEDEIRDVLARAREAFAGDPENLEIMENAAKEAGFAE
ncbi:c-type cytochrome biogenesis protein CcmI [Roseovarius phycicola]|uniref:C-type cytochrome biogenesis protein CcmI n=1 Tax=Roseovarius phycicola TaxID=3080976 RepID=A0ABZ2HRA6_9RHOB